MALSKLARSDSSRDRSRSRETLLGTSLLSRDHVVIKYLQETQKSLAICMCVVEAKDHKRKLKEFLAHRIPTHVCKHSGYQHLKAAVRIQP